MHGTRTGAWLAVVAALAIPASALAADGPDLVAVLELQSTSRAVSVEETQFIAGEVRKAAANDLERAQYVVMTREAMDVLVTPSQLACLAGQCLVEIGRKLQARYVIGGSLRDVGSMLGIALEAYDTRTGALLGSEQERVATVDEAVPQVRRMAGRLVARVTGKALPPEPAGVPPAAPAAPAAASPDDPDAWRPYVNRPVALLNGHAEVTAQVGIGLTKDHAGEAGAFLLSGAYGLRGFEIGAILDAAKWYLQDVVDASGQPTGQSKTASEFGGVTAYARWGFLPWLGAEVSLFVPGRDLADRRFSLNVVVPFKYAVVRDLLALEASLALYLGFERATPDNDNNAVQTSVRFQYGVAVNPLPALYLELQNRVSKRLAPDRDTTVGLAFLAGWTIAKPVDLTVTFSLDNLYPAKSADARSLMVGLTYHFGWH